MVHCLIRAELHRCECMRLLVHVECVVRVGLFDEAVVLQQRIVGARAVADVGLLTLE